MTIEQLPKWLLCVPLVAQWMWLGLRYGSLTLPSVVNPAVENGGLAGESKLAYLERIGRQHAPWVALTRAVKPGEDAARIRRDADLPFPLIAKPDIGWCGYGVQQIGSAAELQAYAASLPHDATYLLQAFVKTPNEAGLFYCRHPDDATGRLVAIALRHPPQVKGDGVLSVAQLAQRHPKLRRTMIPARIAARVPAVDEIVVLTTVASLRVGGTYEDGARLISPALAARVDDIARSMSGFNFGRFDVKFTSEEDLQAGRFQIIEINGAGSEAIQFWDPHYTMLQSLKGVFRKQSDLFALAHSFRARGGRPVGVRKLVSAWLAQQRLIRRYPASN